MNNSPIFIIGAARSGTNILRDTLTSFPGFQTWPCDEIDLIWRHGNLARQDDLFGYAEARPEVVSFIKNQFEKLAHKTGAATIVEKTCANSMRVPFIEAIFPDARYLYIVRDGRDVALSAAKRWTAPANPAYLLKKLRYAPPQDIHHHAVRFVKNRINRLSAQDKRLSFWGPRFPGMGQWVAEKPLLDVCAKQWASSVLASDHAFDSVDGNRKLKITYEQLTSSPKETILSIGEWAGESFSNENLEHVTSRIWRNSTGSPVSKYEQISQAALDVMKPVLEHHAYKV